MKERHPFTFQSLPDVTFHFEPSGFFSGWKVFVDGEKCKKKGSKLFYTDASGTEHIIQVKMGIDFGAPTFIHEGESASPVEPMPAYLAIWALLPLGLLAVGGAIGGALGGLAWALNMGVLRTAQPLVARIALTLLIDVAAAGTWYTIASMLLKHR